MPGAQKCTLKDVACLTKYAWKPKIGFRSRSLSFEFSELDFAWLWPSWPSPDLDPGPELDNKQTDRYQLSLISCQRHKRPTYLSFFSPGCDGWALHYTGLWTCCSAARSPLPHSWIIRGKYESQVLWVLTNESQVLWVLTNQRQVLWVLPGLPGPGPGHSVSGPGARNLRSELATDSVLPPPGSEINLSWVMLSHIGYFFDDIIQI